MPTYGEHRKLIALVLDPEELADLVPLASHIFYRTLSTLPSLMRSYYESLKNRQLSLSLLSLYLSLLFPYHYRPRALDAT